MDRAAVVLLYDGLRVVRYAEPASAAGAAGPGDRGDAVLDFARTDGAEAASAAALVVGRAGGNVRYLTAPWVSEARVRDLLRPEAAGEPLRRSGDGVTAPMPSTAATTAATGTTVSATAACRAWPALEVRMSPVAAGSRAPQVLADLAELTPARLTYGNPAGPPREASESGAARAAWARTACRLPQVRGMGVRAVNAWPFARQPLPGDGGTAAWVCTRAETWQGRGSRVWAQFLPPAAKPASPAAVAARAENTTACGPRAPRVLAGVLWKSRTGQWYVLAAGSGQVASITASGGVRGEADGNLLAVPARPGARAALKGRVAGGRQLGALR
ncbi:hypothetical protein AB0C51_24200 [Streptomyces pathocidini]|uniref:hypothetical protein n=1 Tax=Streptomyces pathocidini TaxID=1650571 RepID=UPI0033FD057F